MPDSSTTTLGVITPPTPNEHLVEDCLGSLFDLENSYSVPNLVEAVVRLIAMCCCSDDPAECAGCLIEQRLAACRSLQESIARSAYLGRGLPVVTR